MLADLDGVNESGKSLGAAFVGSRESGLKKHLIAFSYAASARHRWLS